MNHEPTATGGLLWARAGVLAAFALLTGAVAHVQADGLLPGRGVLLALVVVGALVCAPLLRREGGTLRVTALLVSGQSAVHVALAATAGHRGDPVTDPTPAPAPAAPAGTGARRGSYFDVAYSAPSSAGTGPEGPSLPTPLAHAVADVAAHPAMAATHLLAALVCGWWLARGERALWRVLLLAGRGWGQVVAPLLAAWVRAAQVVRPRPALSVVPASTPEPRPVLPILSRSLSRRGPPRRPVGAAPVAA